jgi:hypothetical protein
MYNFILEMSLQSRIRYVKAKAKLAGIFSDFPCGLLLFTFGLIVYLFAQGSLTPFSVSVSGYTRRDGTQVSAHTRRPAGSREHDKPIQTALVLGVVLMVLGGSWSVKAVHRFVRKSDYDLLPPLAAEALAGAALRSYLPELPAIVRLPSRSATARKDWHCTRCKQPIYQKEIYWYGESPGYFETRNRICARCRRELVQAKARSAELMQVYRKAYPAYVAELRAEKTHQFKSFYGVEPKYLPDRILELPQRYRGRQTHARRRNT